ncbi:hypothetical protein BDV18DRAFT_158088 [Aspergillus unguis]
MAEKVHDTTPMLGHEDQFTAWHALSRSKRHLKRSLKALLALGLLTSLVFAGFIYLTIQLGRERDLVLHLEQQIRDYESHGNGLSKRGLAWFLGAALWTANQAFAFYGLASSCKSFNDSAGNAALCIWGAVSTAATFIGAGAHGATSVMAIHDRLAQNGISIGNWKRDDAVAEAEATMSDLLKLPVTLDGFMPHHHPKLARMNLTEGTMWPVFHFHNHQKTSMHFTMTGYETDHAVMTLGFGHKSENVSLGKRETYQDEYFSNGGIDFTDCFNDAQDTYVLNTDSDYQQMDSDIQCYFPDLSTTYGAQIEIFDANVETTIGAGSIAAYRGSDHASSISDMPGCPNDVSTSDQCQAA